MNPTQELVAIVQRERERNIEHDRLARIASCVRACCEPGLIERISRTLRGAPSGC